MNRPATIAELQLIELVYDDVEHGKLDAAVAKMREHYVESNAPAVPRGEILTLKDAIENLDAIAYVAENVTTAVHFYAERKDGFARAIRLVLAQLSALPPPDIDEGQRQMILLALAKLTFGRPGWATALRETAKQLHGEAMFDQFISHGPDVQAIIT